MDITGTTTPSATIWLDLSEAARILGVHFTTLRRWADQGKVPCIRTPGGRRRFSRVDLDNALAGMQRSAPRGFTAENSVPLAGTAVTLPYSTPPVDAVHTHAHHLAKHPGSWLSHINEEQRQYFRFTGQRLLGLLLQYNSRLEDGEAFLDEARRLAQGYGQICSTAGMTITETVQAFLTFQRSILETIHATRSLSGTVDPDSIRLYQRTTHYFDTLLLATVESFNQANPHNGSRSEEEHQVHSNP